MLDQLEKKIRGINKMRGKAMVLLVLLVIVTINMNNTIGYMLTINESALKNVNHDGFYDDVFTSLKGKHLNDKNITFPWMKNKSIMLRSITHISKDTPYKSRCINIKNHDKNRAVIYVDDDNTQGPWLGTPEYPYRFISDGVLNAGYGDTVFIYNGFYHESVYIDKTISIIGENKDKVIIDGYGLAYCVGVAATDNVLVSNLTVKGAYNGIMIMFSSYCTIKGCCIYDNYYGVNVFDESYSCSIQDCFIDSNEGGVWFLEAESCSIINSTISNQVYYGVYLDCSPNSYLRGNTLQGNGYSFGIDGWSENCLHDIDNSNTINGEPILYLVNEHGLVIDEQYSIGFLALYSCSDITVLNQSIEGVIIISSDSVTISNTTVDHTVYGVYVMESTNVELNSIDTVNCCLGLLVVDSEYVSVYDSVFTGDYGTGIHLFLVYQCSLSYCLLSDYDMFIVYGVNIRVNGCLINDLVMIMSYSSILSFNDMDSLGIYGDTVYAYKHEIDTSNYIRGRSVYYTTGDHDIIIDESSPYGFIGLINPYNVTIKDVNVNGIIIANGVDCLVYNVSSNKSEFGIILFDCVRTTIRASFFHNNTQHGMVLSSSSSNPVSNNQVINCALYDNHGDGVYGEMINGWLFHDCLIYGNMYGLYLYGSSNCIIDGCTVSSNTAHGVYLSRSPYTTVRNCLLYDNNYGVCISSSNCYVANCEAYNNTLYGLYFVDGSYSIVEYCYTHDNLESGVHLLFNSTGNIIRYNMIKDNNKYGLSIRYSAGNLIYNNNIIGSGAAGFYLQYTRGNRVYQNNLLGNTLNVISYSSNTIWDYESKGNYWSDYNGTDSDGDGIGDTPYIIPSGGVDRYPLMTPWSRYTVIDLGSLPDSEGSIGYSINNHGCVVGISVDMNGLNEAVSWDNTGAINILSKPAGALWSEARSVNSNGVVAGSVQAHACLWIENEISFVGSLGGGGCVSYSYDVNDNLFVVGVSYIESYQHESPHAFMYDYYNDSMVDLGALPGYSSSCARSINNHGLAAGYSTKISMNESVNHPTLWLPGDGAIGLPLPERSVSGEASCVNDHGVVSGYVTMRDHRYKGVIWVNQQPLVLPSLGGAKTFALCVNNFNQTAGSSTRTTEEGLIATLWFNDVAVDLNHLISPVEGWRLNEVKAVNDHGLIVGVGTHYNVTRAFLLIQNT